MSGPHQPGKGPTLFTFLLRPKVRARPREAAEGRLELEALISRLLRAGVVTSATIVAFGAVIYLARHGADRPLYRVFRGEPSQFTTLGGIVGAAVDGSGRGLIQFGLLVLLATPVCRVLLSLFSFAAVGDWLYAAVAAIVLATLALGFSGGGLG